jgi:cell division protein FtsW
LLPIVAAGAGIVTLAILHNPERLERVMVFMDPAASKSDASYQLWQAILAFGAGGVDGVGIGNGRQQMAFLPEAHTDFIFAIVGEELGVAFTLAVVFTFAIMFIAGVLHLRRAPNLFQYLLVAGALLLLTLQSVINLGVVTGLLPTKGMSLPFISYGGSNLLLMAAIVGLMINTQTAWSRPVLKDRERQLKELTT